MKPSRKSGFTLIEIMVVLVLATILSSITFGAFRSISQGNKRTTCQSNLSQIYKSARLYAQDYNGEFPYLNPEVEGTANQPATPFGGLGLWSLYAFPTAPTNLCTPTNFNDYNTDLNLPLASDDGTQLAGYVRSAKIFHCPADRFDREVQLRTSPTTCATATAPTASISIQQDGATYLNPAFLSYQTIDDIIDPAPRDTYSSFRVSGPTASASRRQLTYFTTDSGSGVTRTPERPLNDKTVVTWCRFHRTLDNTGATVVGSRNYDNVLFSDGTVQSLSAQQTVQDAAGTSGQCAGWKRVPREKADSMASVTDCTPSS